MTRGGGGFWGSQGVGPLPHAPMTLHSPARPPALLSCQDGDPLDQNQQQFQKAAPFPPPWSPALLISPSPKQQIRLLLWPRLCRHEHRPLQPHGASRWPQRIPVGEPSCALLHPSIPQRMLPKACLQPGTPQCPAPGALLMLWCFSPPQPSL